MRPSNLHLALTLSTLALTLAACAPARSTTQTGKSETNTQTGTQATTPAAQPTPATTVKPKPTPSSTSVQDGYAAVPYLAAKPAASYPKAAQVIVPGKKYRALLTTSKGLITIDLNSTAAPIAVNSFVFLALNHFYDGLKFHRVIDGFMAQGGDPTGTGAGGPGYSFTTETSPEAKFDTAGVLGMARAQSRDSNGSQFFITLAPATFLTGDYTVFGKVAGGQNAVSALTKTENGSAVPDTIKSVQIWVAK
jgi:cyclophilin family peptidyl-prolyl cis-trans isomerase